MVYTRAIREADFRLYIEALSKIVPWFFALVHTHYSRWAPIHLRDVVSLNQLHPDVYAEFVKRTFVIKKSSHGFSAFVKGEAGWYLVRRRLV